ncbi:hypothetical protein AXF42_Ash019454 [Apostasia shenzhenica]|uniref:Uncharacterized protein n=1 Tax=Apostasia shenzhenica TaxID=1088818 RepID=A0A2I0AYD2_9ASPA|nr:hypothetical protein AXF42_Ash019454 [Apostasia shenzhenica]
MPANTCNPDWLGTAYDCKEGSLSCVLGPRFPHTSLDPNVDGSVPEFLLCRPWERVDLLRRLATFMPSNWFGKPQGASSLACTSRGWVNTGIDKIDCEICSASVNFFGPTSSEGTIVDASVEAFTEQLDTRHKVNCPWRGNTCADGLIQFPPTPSSALIGGFKDRFDGLLQFPSLPLIAHSVVEKMRLSRNTQFDQFLSQLNPFSDGESSFKLADIFVTESAQRDALYNYCRAQKLISLCEWEPRWLPNMQDCEENSTQSAGNACSISPTQEDPHHCQYNRASMNFSSTTRWERANKSIKEFRFTLRLPLLDCCLCGATVRLWDFVSVIRPPCFGPNYVETPDQCKKSSAASGINGWVDKDGVKMDQMDDLDDAATENEKSPPSTRAYLNLAVTESLPLGQSSMPLATEHFISEGMRARRMTMQPSESEVGDCAASYESNMDITRVYFSMGGSDQAAVLPSLRDSARASSVIAMNTVGHSVEDDSSDTVENYPLDAEEVGDNQEMMSRLAGKVDNDSKVFVSTKAESVESSGKDSHKLINDGNAHPSLSCNAAICSANESSKEEVTRVGKATDEYTLLESDNVPVRQKVQGNTANMQEPQVQRFDPIGYHNSYCPWVNGYVTAAGCSASSSSSSVVPCGWELTLDALDTFQRLGHIPNQAIQSESAASLYKVRIFTSIFFLKSLNKISNSSEKKSMANG